MLETQLREVLRRALWSSLAVPFAIGSVACGGAVTSSEPAGHDGGTTGHADTGTSPVPDASCGVAECTGICIAGYVYQHSCVDGVPECRCVPGGPSADGGPREAGLRDAGDPCHPSTIGCVGAQVPLSCFDASALIDGAFYSSAQCTIWCGGSQSVSGCAVEATDGGSALSCFQACTGRRPPGLRAERSRGSVVGRYFAESAHLEAASVDAFDVLRQELAAHGAPAELLHAAEVAREDEVRHARMTGRVARRYGSRPAKARMRRPKVRSLEALAIENAAEGCVRETLGALIAMHQSRAASDRGVRDVMRVIAPDETRHAALGWQVAAWADARLSPEARIRVREAQEAAIHAIREDLAREVPADLVAVAGLPRPEIARRMVDALSRTLWNRDAPGSREGAAADAS